MIKVMQYVHLPKACHLLQCISIRSCFPGGVNGTWRNFLIVSENRSAGICSSGSPRSTQVSLYSFSTNFLVQYWACQCPSTGEISPYPLVRNLSSHKSILVSAILYVLAFDSMSMTDCFSLITRPSFDSFVLIFCDTCMPLQSAARTLSQVCVYLTRATWFTFSIPTASAKQCRHKTLSKTLNAIILEKFFAEIGRQVPSPSCTRDYSAAGSSR